MRVLITGISGLIGRATARRFLEAGWQVRGTSRSIRPDSSDGEVVNVGDISGTTDWSRALEGVNAVIHVAGVAHQTHAVPQAELDIVNVDATHHLVTVAAASGVRRFIFISSAKIHGERTGETPFTEVDAPFPSDRYALSKLRAEEALWRGTWGTQLDPVVLRCPLVYGAGVKANFLALMRLVDRGIPLPLGGVQNRRSFLYSRNLADASYACMTSTQTLSTTFLVSDNEDLSTPELIRRIAKAMEKPARLWSVPTPILRATATLLGRKSTVDRLTESLAVDISSISKRLAWSPPHSVADGLRETVRWYHEQSYSER
jgi:nucleoside-diphosphate-sugar epimerase